MLSRNIPLPLLSLSLLAWASSSQGYSIEDAHQADLDKITQEVLKPCREKYKERRRFLYDDTPTEEEEEEDDSTQLDGQQVKIRHYDEEAEDQAVKDVKLVDCIVNEMRENILTSTLRNDFDIKISIIDGEHNAVLSYDTSIPLGKSSRQKQALSLQPGFVLSLQSESRSFSTLNMGTVYRFTFLNGILGVNLFYDREEILNDGENNSLALQRGSFGVDYQHGKSYFFMNSYHPIGEWVRAGEDHRERVLGGYDIHFERLLTEKFSLRLGVSFWDYSSSEDQFNQSLELSYQLSCKTKISLELEHHPIPQNYTAWLQLNVSLGGARQNPKSKKCAPGQPGGKKDLLRPVKRVDQVLYERESTTSDE